MKSHTEFFEQNGIPHDIQAIVTRHGKIDRWFHAKDGLGAFALVECGATFYSVDVTDGKTAGFYPKSRIDRILKADLNACYERSMDGGRKESPCA